MDRGGKNSKCPKVSDINSSNEANIFINNIETNALLDTNSCVSTASKTFYETNFKHLNLLLSTITTH